MTVSKLGLIAKPSSTHRIFRAALIYAIIGIAVFPLTLLMPISFHLQLLLLPTFLLPPALISLAQFLDSRSKPKTQNNYRHPLIGLTVYIVVINFLIPAAFLFLLGNILYDISYNIINLVFFLASILAGALILGVTFPMSQFRKPNGKRTALFWVTIMSVIIAIIVVVGLAVGFKAAAQIGEAF